MKKSNNLSQRRRGAKGTLQKSFLCFTGLCALAPLREVFCPSANFFTPSECLCHGPSARGCPPTTNHHTSPPHVQNAPMQRFSCHSVFSLVFLCILSVKLPKMSEQFR